MKKENKGMKSKKKSWLVLIVVVLMIAACGYVSAYGYGKDHIGTAKNIKLGLDLATSPTKQTKTIHPLKI